jgi:hypothetical protein
LNLSKPAGGKREYRDRAFEPGKPLRACGLFVIFSAGAMNVDAMLRVLNEEQVDYLREAIRRSKTQ